MRLHHDCVVGIVPHGTDRRMDGSLTNANSSSGIVMWSALVEVTLMCM